MLPALAAVGLIMAMPSAATALPAGNLLTNPGAEVGPVAGFTDPPVAIPGWIRVDGAAQPLRAVTELTNSTARFPHDTDRPDALGCRMFAGPLAPREGDDSVPGSSQYSASQTVALPADAPGKTVRFGAVLGRYGSAMFPSSDFAVVSLAFRTAGGGAIGPATSVDDYSPTSATTQELTAKAGSVAVPAGAASAVVTVSSVALGLSDANRGPSAGTADNVNLTFDASVPAGPPAGCRPPTATTGGAPSVAATTATIAGVVDTQSEDGVRSVFRYGVATTDRSSTEVAVPAATSPTAVTALLADLTPATTYRYRLIAVRGSGADRVEVGGDVRTFTTAASPVTPPPAGGPQTPAPSPAPDQNPGPLAVRIAAKTQRLGAVLAGGFSFTLTTTHQLRTLRARIFVVRSRRVRVTHKGRKTTFKTVTTKLPVGDPLKATALAVGTPRVLRRTPGRSSKAAALIRAAIEKRSTVTLRVDYTVVDGLGRRLTGTSKRFTSTT